jgi:hypothetical protein
VDFYKVAATRRNVGDLTDPHNNGATIKLGHTVEIIGQVARDLARTGRKSGPVGTYTSIGTYDRKGTFGPEGTFCLIGTFSFVGSYGPKGTFLPTGTFSVVGTYRSVGTYTPNFRNAN